MYTEDHIDEETGEHVYVIKHWLKNYKIKRDIPLTEEAFHIIDEVKKIRAAFGYNSDYLFSQNDNPVKYYPINNSMKKLCREADLPEHRMYVLRKTWISALVDSGMFTLSQIAEMAGNTPAVIMSSYYGRRQEIPNGTSLADALRAK